jgi:ligand-binding sensor domain-containing protein
MIDALTIYIADDGDVWFGDLQKGVFIFRDSDWISLPFPQQRSDAFKIEAIAQGSAGPGSIWVTDSIFAFQYDGIEWHLFERNTTEGFAPTGDIRSLLQDGYGHIWIGHGGGVSVLAEGADTVEKPDDVWRQCSNSSTSRMPAGTVTDLALGNGGRDVWLVTESGLARVRTDESLAEDCARWRWDSWPEQNTEDAFWEPNHEFRVAVDESAVLSTTTVWIINRQRGRVRRLELP